MRKSAIGTRISFLIVVISIAIIVLNTIFFQCSIIENIGYGILGSGFVSLVLTFSEYSTSKRETLENYYLSAIEITNMFRHCNFEDVTDKDFELASFKSYYEDRKAMTPEIYDKFVSDGKERINKLCALFEIPDDVPKDEELLDYFLQKFENRDIELKEKMNTYIALGDYKKTDFENAFGKIYYLFCQTKRTNIYNRIHKPIQDKKHEIIDICYYLKMYVKGESNNSCMAYDFLRQAIKSIYSIKEDDLGMIVYPDFADRLGEECERMRCDIYGEQYVEPQKRPIFAKGNYIRDYMDAT